MSSSSTVQPPASTTFSTFEPTGCWLLISNNEYYCWRATQVTICAPQKCNGVASRCQTRVLTLYAPRLRA
jgi:hypothetical protein